MYARATSPGPRFAGAFIRNVQVRLTSPAAESTNTSSTATLQAVFLDPFRRSGGIVFALARAPIGSDQTSSQVNGQGWADTPLSWVTAAFDNGGWYYRARSSGVKVGAGPSLPLGRWANAVHFYQSGGAGLPRSLYLYENRGVQALTVAARDLYLYVNRGIQALSVAARSLYLYSNRGIGLLEIESRSLYLYLQRRDGEVFPYLNHIDPDEQYEGGQVDLYGDGFGQYLDATQAATLSVSGTSGGNIPSNVRDGSAAAWLSTNGASSWIRFTWGSARRIVAVVLEGAVTGSWGIPRFKFDDATQQDGADAVPGTVLARDSSTEYPVGHGRVLYWLATPKVSTYVEVAIASGGSGTNRGFAEVWVIEETTPAQNAETAEAVLNLGNPSEQSMGIVAWQNRSPNWYPANSGLVPLAAATVTVPVGAVSGLVKVREND